MSLSDSSSSSSLNITREEPEMARSRYNLGLILHWFSAISLLVLSLYLIVLALGSFSLFSLHPIFMGIGFLVLFPQAIVIFDSDRYSSIKNHKQRTQYHVYCQVGGIICAAIGFLAIYVNKNLYNKQHFKSYHGLAGLAVTILVFLVGIGGTLTNYSMKLRNHVRPVVLKIFHSAGGILTVITGYFTVLLGFYSHWYEKNGNPHFIVPIFILIGLSAFLVLRKSSITLKERILDTFGRNNL